MQHRPSTPAPRDEPRSREDATLGWLDCTATDPQACAREALRALLAPPAMSLRDEPQRVRNLLLDACGSDHRPLVELLLFAGERGVPEGLPPRAFGPGEWEREHARQAMAFAARTFVQMDAARWAVESWAYALGVIDARQLRARAQAPALALPEPPRPAPPPRTVAQPPGWVRAQTAPPPRPRATPTPVRPGAAAGTARGRRWNPMPTWRSGTLAPTAAPRPIARRGPLKGWTRLDLATAALFFVSTISFSLIPLAVPVWRDRNQARATPTTAPLGARAGEGAVTPPAASRGAVPGTPIDTPSAPPVALPSEPADAHAAPPDAPLPPAPSPLVSEEAEPIHRAARGVPLAAIAAGLAGQYVVRVVDATVTGSRECAQLARALDARGATTESVAHEPGAMRFRLTSRPGVEGMLAEDGSFATPLVHGARDGVAWAFHMEGRFTSTGFTAVSETSTSALVGWRREQRCVTTARLEAVRQGGAGTVALEDGR